MLLWPQSLASLSSSETLREGAVDPTRECVGDVGLLPAGVWALEAALREVVLLLSRSTCLRRSCMVVGWPVNSKTQVDGCTGSCPVDVAKLCSVDYSASVAEKIFGSLYGNVRSVVVAKVDAV